MAAEATQLALFKRQRTASFSDDGRHRYDLCITWGPGPSACFVMLNPSVADAERDDPTMRKIQSFVRRWNQARPKAARFGGLAVVNLYSLVATDPRLLRADLEEAAGDPRNVAHILGHATDAELVVAAWGALPARLPDRRDQAVVERLEEIGVELRTIKPTTTGCPSHPLYLPSDLNPVPWSPPWR